MKSKKHVNASSAPTWTARVYVSSSGRAYSGICAWISPAISPATRAMLGRRRAAISRGMRSVGQHPTIRRRECIAVLLLSAADAATGYNRPSAVVSIARASGAALSNL
jgi:hypothetical protein